MINNKELEISNMSYTNKDFGAVYTEILDTANRISKLWSPRTSNESDPGVVLLKFLAFVADKLNYNVDKNILETSMPSATQETSMRKLCDMMGYHMNYFISASTNVTFTYKGSGLNADDEADRKFISLPAFSTVISNEDSSVQYVLWETASLDTTKKTDTVVAKEGYLNTFNVGDSDKITLDNLDTQNRLYFGEASIAQNGILIKAYGETDSNAIFWECVDNLNIQDPGKKCFKFGFDSSVQLPYIEFPTDVANLIGEGLSIRYLVTSGYYGNVGVGNLSKLLSPTSVVVTPTGETISFTNEEGNSDLNIKNNSAAVNGLNPETIDSAYNSFKKIVGTFETLVTCRDYANYIYNEIFDSIGNHVVSNVQVGDRRTDINLSKNIITYGENGQYTINSSDDYAKLLIYALKGINNPSNQSEYKDSFSLMSGGISAITDILNSRDSVATISYRYDIPGDTDIALIKLIYNLDVKITTTYKVNAAEQLDIKKNIIEALRRDFYARNVDYGYEIPYDSIYNCIMDSDSRIKSIILKEPDLRISYTNGKNQTMYPYGSVGAAGGDYTDSPYLKVLAKNVLAGRVPLFNEDTRFSYEFGMSPYGNGVPTVLEKAEAFYTESPMEIDSDFGVVAPNSVVQLIGPKLVDEMEYSAYINYYYRGATVSKNTDTVLGTDDKLLLVYTDSSQNQVEILYEEGDIIRSTFDLTPTDESTATKINKQLYDADIIAALGVGTVGCLGIATNENICKRAIVRHVFDSTIKVAWLVSDNVDTNYIADKFVQVPGTSDEWEFILGDTDYFIYSLDGESSYEIFGGGTSLRISGTDMPSSFLPGNCNIPNLNDLYEYGVESLTGILKQVSFSSGVTLTVQANSILTLAQGDSVKLAEGSIDVDNDWAELDEDLIYKYLGDTEENTLDAYNIGSGIYDNWRIRSRLDLVAGPEKTQILAEGQSITFIRHEDPEDPDTTTEYTIEGDNGGRIRTNMNLDLAGGGSSSYPISLSLVDPTSITEGITYPVSVLSFTDVDNIAETFPRSSGYYTSEIIRGGMAPFSTAANPARMLSVINPSDLSADYYLIMLYVSWLDTATGTLSISSSGANIFDYNTGNPISSISPTDGNKMYILQIPASCNGFTLYTGSTTSQGKIMLSTLYPIKGVNSRFKLSEIETQEGMSSGALSTALLTLIKNIDTEGKFYYNCNLDSSEEIEEEDLHSPFAYVDPNNIASKFTLPYMDVDDSSIEITRSSKL